MPVRASQRNDGVANGVEQVVTVPAAAGWTDQQLLDWKVAAHQAKGFSASVQQAGRRVVMSKSYSAAERAIDPGLPATVEKTLRIA